MQLQAPQLEFLLDDLSRKLQHSLSASASSRRSFLKVSIGRYLVDPFWSLVADRVVSITERGESVCGSMVLADFWDKWSRFQFLKNMADHRLMWIPDSSGLELQICWCFVHFLPFFGEPAFL